MLNIDPSTKKSQVPVSLSPTMTLPSTSLKAEGVKTGVPDPDGAISVAATNCTELIACLVKERSFITVDVTMFTKLKWSLQLVEQSGITRVTADAARDTHQIQCSGDVGGLLYPYCDRLNEDAPLMARLRRDDDPETGKASNPKYLQRPGAHYLYLVPGSAELVRDPKIPAIIVEAEKSALSLLAWSQRTGHKILPVAIGGCWGWRDLPQLAICCWGRGVIVMPDSNASSNEGVGKARTNLVNELHRYRADVFIANVPAIEGVNGPDDLLALPDGDDRLQDILDHELIFCKCPKASASDSWPDPEPLGGELPPVPTFDLQLLPECLRPYVEDTAERMGVPLDYPAIVSVLCLAGVTNRRAFIQPKQKDSSWTECANLWGGIIAPPGMKKSPLIEAITKPLLRIDTAWQEEDEYATSQYLQKHKMYELKVSAWESQVKQAFKKGTPTPEQPSNTLVPPVSRLLITQDATYEALTVIMVHNPSGLFVVLDELSGWIAELDREGRQGERGFYLSSWNGKTGHKTNRIGRGQTNVPACCLTMLGSIQPSMLGGLMAEALRDGVGNDGLIQRFQLLIYPDVFSNTDYIDRQPNETAIQEAEKTYRRLVKLDDSPPLKLLFSPDAQHLFKEWFVELEKSLREADIHPAMISHLAKYRSLMPKLALLFELADGGTKAVSLEHAQQAGAFCEYLKGHAHRIYSMIIPPKVQAASELAQRLAHGWKREAGRFTVREVYRNGWRGLFKPEEVLAALSILENAGWVRHIEGNKSKGRPTDEFLINPKIKG